MFGARHRASLAEFQRGYAGGRQERQRIIAAQAAAQARAATPLPGAVVADAFLRGAIAGQHHAVAQFGGDPRVAAAYRAGYHAMQAGEVLSDRRINWKSGWGVVPLTASPSEIRQMARALDERDEAPLERGEQLARVYGGPPVHIKF